VRGQPCVWCGGGPCTSSRWSLCEPFDWALNGEGQAFDYFHPKHAYRLAGCKNDRPAALSLRSYADVTAGYFYNPLMSRPLVPFWVAKKPTAEELSCLKPAEGGCHKLRDMASCMSSKDGRSIASFQGMKIAGEPCVWCGGIACTTNSTSLCEPFDYVMYGEGVAFSDFSAKGVYKVSTCDKGDVALPSYDYSCLETSGSDGCTGIWNAEECLASRDGRSVTAVGVLQVQNQPCVWCGGGPCHSGKTSLCEAFDYAVNGEGRAFAHFHAEGNYRLAACKDGKPKAATLSNFTDFIPGYTFKPLPVPTVPPREQWWVPERPTEANMSCLTYQVAGCSAIKDIGTCLNSRDGRATAATADGLKIHAEPCVWCGGSACHSNSSSYCEPFDYLMRGEGKAFTLFYAPLQFSVANCKTGMPLPEFDFSCLSSESKGCGELTTADTCLKSKDGRQDSTISGFKVHDQPCVWCGGAPCHSSSLSLCEPFDYTMNGEGKAFATFHAKHSYSFAGCKDKRPAAMTYDGFAPFVTGLLPPALNTPAPLVPFWVPEHPKVEDMTCLARATLGCKAVREMKVCLSSRDDSGLQSVQGLKVHGEPCVWCEGGACTSDSSAQCQPFDFLMHGEGLAFTSFLGKGTFSVANCYSPVERPKYEYTCLRDAPMGCSALTDPYACLASKDGRPQLRINGLRVSQEPCVWCGGGVCHSGATTMCEPFDYVMNGAGRAFYNFHAALTYRMAACQDGHPQGATLDGFKTSIPGALPTMKPYWWITEPKPEGDELSCLMDHKFGCYVIRNKETCLGSKDGRDWTEWNGLKIRGEPCVWCGGFPCQSNSTNLCEPYDFLLHGQGKAFLNFNAKTSYNVARCKNNVPVQPTKPESADISTQLSGLRQGANSNSSAVATAPASAATGTTAAGGVEPEGAAGAGAGAQKARSPDASSAGKDCWYECGKKSGYCNWCGAGKACCRDGWSANSAECTGAVGYTTTSNHECVEVPASSHTLAGGTDASEKTHTTVGPAGASVAAADSPLVSAITAATTVPAQSAFVPGTAAPASKDMASLALNTADPPVNAGIPSTAVPGATETTAAPGMMLTVAPASPAAFASVAPVGSTAAPTAETTVAPATLPPLHTMALASTLAPATKTMAGTIGASAPVTIAAASTAALTTMAPAGRTATPATASNAAPLTIAPIIPVVPALSTAAPDTVASQGSTEAPAALADADCWYRCGEKAGDCPAFCGEGKVCCRSGVLNDPPECSGLSLAAFSTIMHHQCVERPAASTSASATGVPGVLLSTSQPEFQVRTSTPAGPHHADARSGGSITYRDAALNNTNGTAVMDDDSGTGIPMWVWILLVVVLSLCAALLASVFPPRSGKKGAKTAKKIKRHARRAAEVGNEDSFVSDASEVEMQTPLVQAQECSANDGQSDLFDLIDQNRDGVISPAEWNRAMGVRAQAVSVAMPAMIHRPGPMMTHIRQAPPPVRTVQPMSVSMRSEPTSVMVPGAMSVARAPAGSPRLDAPRAAATRPYAANIQYEPVSVHSARP